MSVLRRLLTDLREFDNSAKSAAATLSQLTAISSFEP